jgi:flagellar basal body-associated protein FliL
VTRDIIIIIIIIMLMMMINVLMTTPYLLHSTIIKTKQKHKTPCVSQMNVG